MDFTMISQFITGVGFPIVACIYMYKMVEKNNETHKEEIDKLRAVIEKNTIILNKVLDRLNIDDGGDKDAV